MTPMPCPATARAPGRANLIGEHTDYNDGFVMPVAIDRFVTVRVTPSADGLIRLASRDFSDEVTVPAEGRHDRWAAARDKADLGWAAYPLGVVWALGEIGHPLPGGFTAHYTGTVPPGAGLSSSAALEVATAVALRGAFAWPLADVALALACHRAESEFVGVNCGIMDPFACALARADHALLLDCRSRATEHVPLPFAGRASIILCDTGVKHRLADSPYNRRRAECEEAARILNGHFPYIRALRDVSARDLRLYEAVLPAPLRRRARHVVTENERVLRAAHVLRCGDLDAFGDLLWASHDSLRDDFEVSCPELDGLVEAARAGGDAYGARLTGAGFGGCTINLVRAGREEAFVAALTASYRRDFGRDLVAHRCDVVDGAARDACIGNANP